jgi:hypothetical protein
MNMTGRSRNAKSDGVSNMVSPSIDTLMGFGLAENVRLMLYWI